MLTASATVKSRTATRQMPPQQGASHSTETVTCSPAAPPASLTSLEGPPDGHGGANDAAGDPMSDPVDNAVDDATDDSMDLPVTTLLGFILKSNRMLFVISALYFLPALC